MPGITSVELMGYDRPNPKRLTFTRRNTQAFSNRRFPGHIKDNWLVLRGTGLTAAINKLEVVYNGTLYPTRVIEIAAENDRTIHVWFAAYRDVTLELEDVPAVESKPDDEVIGVGAITVTIVTSSGGTAEGQGEITGEGIV